ncbi:hypothetical protein ColTof4_03169 [Colletotrichum tofieldiae]|nr:hypothetical protein ColTof4_03169 [Colletotrichum tofieldiae]
MGVPLSTAQALLTTKQKQQQQSYSSSTAGPTPFLCLPVRDVSVSAARRSACGTHGRDCIDAAALLPHAVPRTGVELGLLPVFSGRWGFHLQRDSRFWSQRQGKELGRGRVRGRGIGVSVVTFWGLTDALLRVSAVGGILAISSARWALYVHWVAVLQCNQGCFVIGFRGLTHAVFGLGAEFGFLLPIASTICSACIRRIACFKWSEGEGNLSRRASFLDRGTRQEPNWNEHSQQSDQPRQDALGFGFPAITLFTQREFQFLPWR